MALYRVEAIVLRSRPFGEADRLVTFLTRERGLHRAVAKGARRPRSTLAAGVQPFTRASFLLWRGRQLDGISQCQVLDGYRPLREELGRMLRASCACELAEATAREGDPAPGLYALLQEGLQLLASEPEERLDGVLLAWQWQWLARCGFRPRLEACAHCGGPLEDGERRFSARAGGLLCHRCGEEKGGVWLSPRAQAVLRFWLDRPLRAGARARAAEPDLRALQAAADALIEAVLERPLRSRPFLAMLSGAQ